MYASSGLADVLDTSRRDGKADLVALGLPDGIDERAFRSVVGRRLFEMPRVARTIERMRSGISDEEGPGLLSSCVPPECLPRPGVDRLAHPREMADSLRRRRVQIETAGRGARQGTRAMSDAFPEVV